MMVGWIVTGLILLAALAALAAGVWYSVTHKGCGGDCTHCSKHCRDCHTDRNLR